MRYRIPRRLARKLAEARKSARTVAKHGKGGGDGDSYAFAKAEDVGNEARRLLAEHGIVVIPSMPSAGHTSGQSGLLIKAEMKFKVVDADTGEYFIEEWVGFGWDYPGDKGGNKACTAATKYFSAGLLGIPFGVDPEEGELASSEAERPRREQDRDATCPDLQAVSGA